MIDVCGDYIATEEDKQALLGGTDFDIYIPRIHTIRCLRDCVFCYDAHGHFVISVLNRAVPLELRDRIRAEQQ